MKTNRDWVIRVDKSRIFRATENDKEGVYFIGYENGLAEREAEKYFSQRESDNDSYRITFDPDPCFISYSFFNGLFNSSLKLICRSNSADISYLANKKKKAKEFFEKYNFVFNVNPALNDEVHAYVDAMLDNIFDISNVGDNYDRS